MEATAEAVEDLVMEAAEAAVNLEAVEKVGVGLPVETEERVA